MTAEQNRITNTLKVQRARKDLTQEQLAHLAGVTRKTINTVERKIHSLDLPGP